MNDTTERTGLEIAVVGMAGRFPGADSIDAFWENLRGGVESIRCFSDAELLEAGVDPALLADPAYVKAAPVLDGIDRFDAGLFGYSPREAVALDPQQRLLLECAWAALDHAGYNTDAPRRPVGVYAGVSMSTYLLNLYSNPAFRESADQPQIAVVLGNDKDYVATRISYKLNLEGPSLTVQTACSTSLVAVHLACQALLSGECDLALAGGASVRVPQQTGYRYVEGAITSPDGHCRAFDAQARGTVLGSGVGMVALKRLEDALADGDTVHAVIKGTAINNDGANKVSYTAPRIDGQARAIRAAQAMAEVEPETVSYIEAHGTGTALGDPIEIAALSQVFRAQTERRQFCAVGSLKTNIGHLDAAAGVAGLIKTVLALRHRQIPPSLNFERPNPAIDFVGSPFYVNTALRDWPADAGPRRAGVSSFGIGGTNAHAVLEEPPAPEPGGPARPWHLLTLSARSAAALERASAELAAHLERHPEQDLADAAFTLALGRRALPHRRVLVCRDRAEAVAALTGGQALTQAHEGGLRPVAFLFPGQGAQHPGMARDLYEHEPVFREQIDRCAELLRPHLGLDLREMLYPAEPRTENQEPRTENQEPRTDTPEAVLNSQFSILNSTTGGGASTILNAQFSILNSTKYTQPALFAVEYALAQLWQSWGVRPEALIGHSVGEYVAACLAGVFSLEDALALVAERGRLMQSMPPGAMLSVALPEPELAPLLAEGLAVAAVNNPGLCVVSGPEPAVEGLERELAARGVTCRRLHTSHAFHSAMMDPILEPFAAAVARVELRPPQIPYLSNVTGAWITPEQATDPRYWAAHLRAAVRFADGLGELLREPGRVLLEVGPGQSLCALARQHPGRTPAQAVIPSLRRPTERQPDLPFALGALGRLWLAGAAVDWAGFYSGQRRRRVELPVYPFERQRYWVERRPLGGASEADGAAPAPDEAAPAAQAPAYGRPDLPTPYAAPRDGIERRVAAIWQELLGIERVGVNDNFYELGGHSLLVSQVAAGLRAAFPVEVPLQRLFETQTVAEQTLLLIEELVLQEEPACAAETLAQIERMPPEAVRALLEPDATPA